jgi:hypothetical protein
MSVAPRAPRRTGARCQGPAGQVRSATGTFRRAPGSSGSAAVPARSGARAGTAGGAGAVVIPFPVSRRGHVPAPRHPGARPVAARSAARSGGAARAGAVPARPARPGRLRLTRRGRVAAWLLAVTVVALLTVLV